MILFLVTHTRGPKDCQLELKKNRTGLNEKRLSDSKTLGNRLTELHSYKHLLPLKKKEEWLQAQRSDTDTEDRVARVHEASLRPESGASSHRKHSQAKNLMELALLGFELTWN